MATATRKRLGIVSTVEAAIKDKPNATGLALIVSNDYHLTQMATLRGTSNDAQLMKESLLELNYAVVYKHNICRMDLLSLLDEAASASFPYNLKRLVFAFSGHGTKDNDMLMQDGEPVNMEFVVSKFLPASKPHLSSIPKLFFIDACRGKKIDTGVTVAKCNDSAAVPRGGKVLESVRFPSEGNFLVAYSTSSGYEAYEFSDRGGLWMTVLANKLVSEDKSIVDILTDVNQELVSLSVPEPMARQFATTRSALPP